MSNAAAESLISTPRLKPLAAFVVSILGAAYCALGAIGLADSICFSEGCAFFKGTALLGIDVYWYGAAWFVAVSVILLVGLAGNPLAWTQEILLLAGLCLDGMLLAVQGVVVPCASCLVVASLLGITVWGAAASRRVRVALLAWSFVFVAALFGLARDAIGPAPLHGSPDSSIKLFMSPTCPSCVSAARALADKAELLDKLAIYPVAKDERDAKRLALFAGNLASGQPLGDALRSIDAEDGVGFTDSGPSRLGLRLIALRNAMFLARNGVRSVPHATTTASGLTALLAATGQADNVASLIDSLAAPAGGEEGCGYAQETSCADESARNARLYQTKLP